MAGWLCADWVGRPSRYNSACALAQTALHCASGRRKDTEQMGFIVITLLPLVKFPCGDANQKFPFLHFPLRGGGVGGGDAGKMQGNFWICPRESASAVEAQVLFVKILRILSEIHSNFVQYTPQFFKLGFCRVRAKRGQSNIRPKPQF